MITLIDVIVLLLAYAGLSLGCAVLTKLVRALPQRDSYEIATTKTGSRRTHHAGGVSC